MSIRPCVQDDSKRTEARIIKFVAMIGLIMRHLGVCGCHFWFRTSKPNGSPPPYMAMKNVDVGCGLRGLLVPANFMSQSAQRKSDSRETEVGT